MNEQEKQRRMSRMEGKDMRGAAAKATLCAALGNIIWGFSFLFTKVGLTLAPHPNVMLAHRFTISALMMVVMLMMGKGTLSLKGKNWKPIFLLALAQLTYYVFESYGVLHTNSTFAGLVLAVVPVVTIASGALFLKEYPTLRQGLFCIMPVAGVILMTASGNELGVVTPLGVIFLVLTLLSSTVYKTANRKAAEEFTPFERTFLILATSSLAFSAAGLMVVEWNVREFMAPLAQPSYLLSMIALGLFCSIAANLLVNYAAGYMSVFKLASFGSLSTLCTMFAGVVFLKEPMNLSLFLGAVLILVGIHQVTRQRPVPTQKA